MKINVARRHETPVSLYVECIGENEFGKNKPIAFILPGGPGADHTSYMRYACLQDVADILFFDPRGCGQSDRGDPSTYTLENYINDLESIREQLNFSQIIVIGKSYGSICALGYALRYPGVVSKLVLAAGAPSFRFLDTAKANMKRLGTRDQIAVCEKLWAGSFKSTDELLNYFELTNALYSVKARTKPHEFDLAKKSKQFSYEVLNEGFRQAFWHFDYEDKLSNVLCPTLILAGKEDWINDVSHAEFMAHRIPLNRLKIFEKASHALETDVTSEYFGELRQFIKHGITAI